MNTRTNDMLMSYGKIKGIVLLGGGDILRKLCAWAISEDITTKVITSPRHSNETVNGVTLNEFLESIKLSYITVEDITHHSVGTMLDQSEDFLYLSLGAAWIFNESVLSNRFNNKLLNLHGTRLPQNRGGGGFTWQILMGNRFGFSVLHRVNAGIDTGEIVALDEWLYPPTARRPIDYEKIYIEKNLDLITSFIRNGLLNSINIRPIVQSEYFSSYWPRLLTEVNGYINWSWDDPSEIEKFICAFDEPYSGAKTFLNGKRVSLKSVFISGQDGSFHSYQKGIIYRKSKSWLCIALNKVSLIVESITDDEGNSIFDSVKVGDRLVTPINFLESSLDRFIYTATGIKS